MHQWTRIVILLMQITLVNEQMKKKIRFQHELKYSRHLIFDFDTIFEWIICRNGIAVRQV